jgi:hypothetical protein
VAALRTGDVLPWCLKDASYWAIRFFNLESGARLSPPPPPPARPSNPGFPMAVSTHDGGWKTVEEEKSDAVSPA